MKSCELKPTYQNLLKTFCEDTISRNQDIYRFVTILDAIEDTYSIALEGNWGSGKTFFVKQTKMVLDAHNRYISGMKEEDRKEIVKVFSQYSGNNPCNLQLQVCVYYDAWENDNDDDPILSLIYAILSSVDNDFSFKETSCVKIAANIMEMYTGVNWNQLIDSLRGEDPLKSLKQAKDMENLVHEFLESLLSEKGDRLVIFIDELDRCKPSYAVRLLERIKHYFSNDRITFVFSVNINELQHTIKKHYGNDFDGFKYLDRFFDLRVALPPANLQAFYESINFANGTFVFDSVCNAVIKTYHFELREIARYIHLTKIAAYEPTHSERYRFCFSDARAIETCLCFVVPIMIGLKIFNAKKYADFIAGRDESPLITIAKAISIRFFVNLLDEGETYNESAKEGKIVVLDEKLKELYKALFCTNYGPDKYYVDIGNLRFDENTKELLLKTVSLLSRYMKVERNDNLDGQTENANAK